MTAARMLVTACVRAEAREVIARAFVLPGVLEEASMPLRKIATRR